MKRFLIFGSLVITILIGIFLAEPWLSLDRGGKKESVSLIKSWGKLPVIFIKNEGQADSRVGYYRSPTVSCGRESISFIQGPWGRSSRILS